MSNRATRRLRACYLYTNGTLVKWFEEFRGGKRIGESEDVIPNFATSVTIWPDYKSSTGFLTNVEGRIIISKTCDEKATESLLKMFKGGKVTATAPSLEGGSVNSKNLGVKVGYVNVESRMGRFDWVTFDNFLCTDFTVQMGHYKVPEVA